jgi:TonB-linked SusC/RagA family outer membrane protein
LTNVSNGEELVASFIGFISVEKTYSGENEVNFVLSPDMIGVEEVIVVGYGTMSKADLTGAVSTVGSDELVKTAAPNITSTLTGKLTGVIARQSSGRPGGDLPQFSIRGKSTIDPNPNDGIDANAVLVLVDGVEREFARIDPNEIESITVLKDAASASIYGSRGANGVILVTTKRGVEGKPTVNYSTSYTISEPTFLPAYFSAGDYTKYLNEASINSGGKQVFTDEQVAAYADGSLPSTNWWDLMMNDYAPMSQHSITASGGDANTKYFISLGYIDQKGLYDRVSYKRYNVRSNIDTKINDQLSVSLDIAARNQFHEQGQVSEEKLYQTLRTAIPTTPAFVPEEYRAPYDELGLNFNGTAGSPIGEADYSGYKKDNYTFLESKLGLKYSFPFVEGLTASFDFSYDKKYTTEKDWTDSYWLNNYTAATGNSSVVPSSSLLTLWQREQELTKTTIQTGLKYNRTFGKHKIDAIFVYEQREEVADNLEAYRDGFKTNTIQYMFAGIDDTKDNDGDAWENSWASYIGRINYNFNEKYLFNFSARADGSSKFPGDKAW